MSSYIALVRKDAKSDFGVDFPDFPGCVTAGETLDEARKMAEEALLFHVDGLLEDGEPLPEPTGLEAVMADPDAQEAVAFLVNLPEPSPRSVRVNVTLPEHILKRIDAWAKSHGLSRSAFLAQAALRSMSQGRA